MDQKEIGSFVISPIFYFNFKALIGYRSSLELKLPSLALGV